MRKLTIAPPPERKIEINGIVFDIVPSDLEALELLLELKDSFARLAENGSTDGGEVVAVLKSVISTLERILGEGATEKILGGRSADVGYMLESVVTPILAEILDFAQSGYSQGILRKYGQPRSGKRAREDK